MATDTVYLIKPTPNGSLLDRSRLRAVEYSDNFKNSLWTATALPPSNDLLNGYIANSPSNQNFGDQPAGGTFQYSQPGDGTVGVTFNDPVHGGLRLRLYERVANAWYGGFVCSVDQNGNGFLRTDGYWEIIAMMPNVASGFHGSWCGFWLNSYQPNATFKNNYIIFTELDMLEWYGAFPDGFHSSYHLWAGTTGTDIFPISTGSDQTTLVETAPGLGYASNALYTAFHKYGILVDQYWVRCYLDDVQVAWYQRNWASTLPMGFILDNVSGGASGQNVLTSGQGPFDFFIRQFNYYPLASAPVVQVLRLAP